MRPSTSSSLRQAKPARPLLHLLSDSVHGAVHHGRVEADGGGTGVDLGQMLSIEDIKDRILQHLAVHKLKPTTKAPIAPMPVQIV